MFLIQNGDIDHIYLNIRWEFFPKSLSEELEGAVAL
jgi:hypothetical protein